MVKSSWCASLWPGLEGLPHYVMTRKSRLDTMWYREQQPHKALSEATSQNVCGLIRSPRLHFPFLRTRLVWELQLDLGFLKKHPVGQDMESACVSASCAHGDMWCAELRCAIKDSQADKVWEAYGRGGACSCVRNSGTYGDNNVHGILSLIILSRKTSTHPHTYICTPIKED